MAGHRFHHSKAEKLLNPKRRELIAPEEVVSLLHISERDVVADLGAGNGYFTVPIAKVAKRYMRLMYNKKCLLSYSNMQKKKG